MYVAENTWLEDGPVRGLGDATDPIVTATDSVTVTACAPDLCFSGLEFPWVGRRTEPMNPNAPCVCMPLLTVPSPWGVVITGAIAVLIVGMAVRR